MDTPWVGGTPLPLSLPDGTWATRYYWENGLRSLNNGELHWLSDSTVGVDPFSITGGVLNITATPSPNPALSGGGYPYISGMITTEGTFAQTYGYFEMRAQLPAGKGLWPAFWLMPQDHTWPPEIDVLEVLGQDPGTLYTFYHTAASGTRSFDGGGHQVGDMSAGFHTYAVNWTPTVLQWFFDGRLVQEVPTPADMHKPMYLLAALGVGGNWPGAPDATTPFPAQFKIDYIRAGRDSSLPPEATSDYNGDGKPDLLFGNGAGSTAIWTMDGSQRLGTATVDAVLPGGVRLIGGRDLNGDQRAEILFQDVTGQPAAWFLDDARLLGGVPIGPNPGPAWRLSGAGDFDGDFRTDLLWQRNDGQPAIWTLNGTTALNGLYSPANPGPEWRAATAGDLDGNGRADIVFQHEITGQVAVWFMEGAQPVSTALVGPAALPGWRVADATDMNDDGRADILFQSSEGQVACWFMAGAAPLGSTTVGWNPDLAWQLV